MGKIKAYIIILFIFLSSVGKSQDVAITQIVSPVSGCNIGLDTIVVTLFNASPFPVGGTFTMQYSVNSVPVSTESFSTSLNASQSIDFAFATLYNFNTDATFLVCASVIFIGDINAANNTSCGNIISDTSVIGGSITSSSSLVCSGNNSGTLTLSGNNNPITQWEYSTNGGNPPWSPVVPTNSSGTQSFTNIIQDTYYRVLIEGGYCVDGYSLPFVVNVDEPSNAGSISGSTMFCSSTNGGNLVSIGVVGNILDWEFSTTGTFPGTSLGTTNDTISYTNLAQTTYYQVTAQNGVCPPSTSAIGVITVLPPSVGGTITGDGIYCLNGNNGTLTLNGFGGDSLYWIYSTVSNPVWQTNSITTSTLNFNNVVETTYYAVVVQFTGCPADTSAIATITIVPNPVADAGVDDTIYIFDSSPLNATGGVFYVWTPSGSLTDPNINNPVASPLSTTTYTVTVSDAQGCSDMDDVTIFVIDTITVPPTTITVCNYITLNGDNLNDVWNITGITFYNETEVTVFNNQGQIVFSQTNYQNDWGGTFNGDELPDGTYFYVVTIAELDFTEKGILTIISDR